MVSEFFEKILMWIISSYTWDNLPSFFKFLEDMIENPSFYFVNWFLLFLFAYKIKSYLDEEKQKELEKKRQDETDHLLPHFR